MRDIAVLLLIVAIASGCKSKAPSYENYESEILKIERVTDNIFQHTSYLDTKSYGLYPCNGMIYFNGDEAIIFDTPTNNEASSELIHWIGEKDIKAVVVTHFHIDCLGGLEEFHSNDIKSYATNKTIKLASAENDILPQHNFDKEIEFRIGTAIAYAKFYGEGHTQDNIIGYIPIEKAMFGGCLIKKLNATKGNLEDANTAEWAQTVTDIKRELPEIEVVIPGHGEPGGVELLDFTIDLFTEN